MLNDDSDEDDGIMSTMTMVLGDDNEPSKVSALFASLHSQQSSKKTRDDDVCQ